VSDGSGRASGRRRRDLARADKVLPGVWRLRLPLPWPGVPHVNAWALTAGSGVVLVDTGLDEPGALGQLERALDQAGLRLDHVRLLVCTHAHSDHYGLAGPIVDAAGCELWMHPNHGHMTRAATDPERALERRIEVARQSGVPGEALRRYQESRKGAGIGIARVVEPDRDLVPGVEVQTDLGVFHVYETPGHAPSHVCLHQPDRGILISGDHLLGRVSLYYDYGHTPDPAGEFLESLDVVDALESSLCLAGHGRPFRDVKEHIEANRREVAERMGRVRAALEDAGGRPMTPFEIVPRLLGDPHPSPMMVNWGLSETLSYLRHLERLSEAARVESEPAERWSLAA
jgi:glyoxylase-like metal-dependent hydrolase (beta-lactamase superfamily II)